jgi:hypothetical protein
MNKSIAITLTMLALALASTLPQPARAADENAGSATAAQEPWSIFPPAPADSGSTDNATWFTPAGWSFALLLPMIGELYLPGDEDWTGGELDFRWFDEGNLVGSGGVYQIEGSFIELQDEDLSAEDVLALMDYVTTLLIDTVGAEILGTQPGVVVAGNEWGEIYMREALTDDPAGAATSLVYYMPEANGIYLLFFYFDDPPNEIVPSDITVVLGGYEPEEDVDSTGSAS